jgi:hypothetical protein
MSIEALQAQAGHSSIASTQLYLHLGADWLADEYRRAAEAIEVQASVDAPMSATPAPRPASTSSRRPAPENSWEDIAQQAPQMAATMTAYLDQLAVSSRPATVAATATAPTSSSE